MAMSNGERIVSFIDIGTNSVRLLVVRLNPNCSYTVISQEKEIVRLGENEFNDQMLKPEAMGRAILVCKKFAELSRTYKTKEIYAVATSAVREAKNKEEFIAAAKREAGIDIRVISGEEEARYIFLGLSSGVHIDNEDAFFIDIGGGSTEVIIGNQNNISYMKSYQYGAIRCSQWFKNGVDQRVSSQDYEKVKEQIYSGIALPNSLHRKPHLAFGSSGTIINLAEIALKNFKSKNRAWDLTLGRKKLRKVRALLCSHPIAERRSIEGINPERADIIMGGTAIMEALMERLDIKEIIVSNRSLRDGLLVDYINQLWNNGRVSNVPIRERGVVQLGRSCTYDESHANTVSSLALQLFDTGREAGLHRLGERERELLKYAALLHDIGDFISFNDHHLHSHYIVSHAELPGLDRQEIKIIANVVRYHRKKPPTRIAMEQDGLDQTSKEIVMQLFPLLRVAENLDRSHSGLVKRCAFRRGSGGSVELSLWSDCECQLEDWGVRNILNLLEESYGREIDINWHYDNPLTL